MGKTVIRDRQKNRNVSKLSLGISGIDPLRKYPYEAMMVQFFSVKETSLDLITQGIILVRMQILSDQISLLIEQNADLFKNETGKRQKYR